jgi:hypothetical protein
VNNTVTLNLFTPAADISLGDGGVQSGFFNITVKNNWVEHAGTTGISMYLNVFNSHIEDNTVIGSTVGLDVLGGLMLGVYETLAWNNTVSGNTFINDGLLYDPNNPSVWFGSLFGGRMQYNNKFVNNTVIGGLIYINKQGNFIGTPNALKNTQTMITP